MPSYPTYAVPRLDLAQAFLEYAPADINFIAEQALPVVRTRVKSGTFSALTREDMLREVPLKRNSKSAYARDDFSGEDKTFACEEYGIEDPIGDDEMKRFSNDFDSGVSAMQFLKLRLAIAQERRASALLFSATWTGGGSTLYTDVATAWSNASADIVGDIEAAKRTSLGLTGLKPNTLILNEVNLSYLLANTAIVGRVQYAQVATRQVVLNALANIFGLERILVGGGVYNSAKEGVAATVANIWSSSYAMVARVPTTSNLAEPGVARSFLWEDDSGSTVVAESYREEQTRSTVYRVRQNMDEVVLDASFAHLMKVD